MGGLFRVLLLADERQTGLAGLDVSHRSGDVVYPLAVIQTRFHTLREHSPIGSLDESLSELERPFLPLFRARIDCILLKSLSTRIDNALSAHYKYSIRVVESLIKRNGD